MKKHTRETFITKANNIHGTKYGYDFVKYVNSTTKVTLVCQVHGKFLQTPKDHLAGKGCMKCSGRFKHTNESFAHLANKIHNNKYDYSLVKYKNNKTPVKIICPIHGVFTQVPNTHLDGSGCPTCAITNSSLNTEEFIRRAKLLFGNYYDYSLVNYKNNHTKVKIVCPVHGVFYQKPNGHLFGWGCVQCGNEKQQYSTAEFIENARKVHGDRYNYTCTKYTGSKTKVKIHCKKHGVFEQRASAHLDGEGCPVCKQSLGEHKIKQYLDKTGVNYITQYKIAGCKRINCLPFDFAIFNTDGTLRCLIEYQGIQHFEIVDWFDNGDESFKLREKRDSIKRDYCIKNNIQLLEISYLQNLDACLEEAGGLLWK